MSHPATTEQTPQPSRRKALMPAALPLALWRLRRTWGLALVAQLGMIAAVTLVWAVPIFTQVSLAAGLQALVDGSPTMDDFYAQIEMSQPSAPLLAAFTQGAGSLRAGELRSWHLTDPRIELNTVPLNMQGPHAQPTTILGEQAARLATDLKVVRGRLPVPSPDALEVALTPSTASDLGVALGGTLSFTDPASVAPLVRVVGIVRPANPAFPTDRNSFLATVFNENPLRDFAQNSPLDLALTSNEAITAYAATYTWPQLANGPNKAICGPSSSGGPGGRCVPPPLWQGTWMAQADITQMSGQDINDFLFGHSPSVSSGLDISGDVNRAIIKAGSAQFQTEGFLPQGTQAHFNLGDQYGDYTQGAEIAIVAYWLLLFEVMGIVLFCLGLIAGLLVERQEPLIATLRSRGASRRQVFGAFAVQSLLLAAIAFVSGGLLTGPVVRVVSALLLPASEQRALAALDTGFGGFGIAGTIAAGITLAITIIVMLRATGRATALNALTLRHESARPTRKPLWQRLYLDMLAAILAFLGYALLGVAYSLSTQAQPSGNGSGGGRAETFLYIFEFVAPAFLLVAGALLFLRTLPPLLRLGERIAARGRGAIAMLALAQLARAAHQTTRIALPLALATCFALFTVAAYSSIATQVNDAATLQAGADFSGRMTTPIAASEDAATRAAAYASLAGVRAASVGYRAATLTTQCNLTSNACSADTYPIQIAAVDPTSYATTVYWPSVDAAQPLAPLMAQLAARRDTASASHVVPVILQSNIAALLHVRPGATFALYVPTSDGAETSSGTEGAPQIQCQVLAVVPFLPGEVIHTNNLPDGNDGALLVDYASFAAAYADTGAAITLIAPNYVWLRTATDTATLTSVRAALASGPLAIGPLAELVQVDESLTANDRVRIMDDSLTGQLVGAGVFGLGAAAALLLALCVTLIASLTAARERSLSFALLRALGTEPRRIRKLVAWEQGIVYTVALLLGIGLGAFLILVALAPLSNLLLLGSVSANTLAASIAWPWPQLGLMLAALALICVVATAAAAWTAGRPSLGAILRLNED